MYVGMLRVCTFAIGVLRALARLNRKRRARKFTLNRRYKVIQFSSLIRRKKKRKEKERERERTAL